MYWYGYGGNSAFNALALSGGALAFLSFIGFIASIVCTVLLYRKFVSTGKATPLGLKKDWGPFIRFESLLIEKILIVLYLFIALSIAFGCAASIISSLFGIMYDPASVLLAILGFLILFVILEVLHRLFFEFMMMTILIWKNTSVIRKTLSGGDDACSAIASPMSEYVKAATAPTPSADSASASHPVAAPQSFVEQKKEVVVDVQPTEPVTVAPPAPSSEWVCSACGFTNVSGSFCAHCGTKRS